MMIAPLDGRHRAVRAGGAREARAQGKTLAAHYAHLVVHGMLHLQGYDHDTAATRARMEARETRDPRRARRSPTRTRAARRGPTR